MVLGLAVRVCVCERSHSNYTKFYTGFDPLGILGFESVRFLNEDYIALFFNHLKMVGSDTAVPPQMPQVGYVDCR
jgi:hypothetical protein